ncbi:MAG: hypothetical protein M3Q42_12340 [Pseudomonadota bacterium]|nr:hypothetical protein [Pseudomonadota bacterium]
MNGSSTGSGQTRRGLPPMEELLRYERHLEGEAFTRGVLAVAAQRNQRRVWVLAGAAILAVATVLAIKPERFTFLSNFNLPLQGASEILAALPVGGVLAMLLVSFLVVGISNTVDSI